MKETEQVSVKGQFTTAEITHVLEALKLEGNCYIKNHVFMHLAKEGGPVREWHDNVTRPNLDELKRVANECGLNLPFPKPLEDRENELKSKMRGKEVAGILTDGEILSDVRVAAKDLGTFYAVSLELATHDRVRNVFRSGFERVADHIERLDQALKSTDMFYPPPIAHQIGYVAEKGVNPK